MKENLSDTWESQQEENYPSQSELKEGIPIYSNAL